MKIFIFFNNQLLIFFKVNTVPHMSHTMRLHVVGITSQQYHVQHDFLVKSNCLQKVRLFYLSIVPQKLASL